MAGYCWQVLVCIVMLYEVSVCFCILSNSISHIRYIAHNQRGIVTGANSQ